MQVRENPISHRLLVVDDDGTIPSWKVTYEGEDIISKRSTVFIHKEDAESEYNWIMRRLKDAALWEKNKHTLTCEENERLSWSDLFEEPGISNWMA